MSRDVVVTLVACPSLLRIRPLQPSYYLLPAMNSLEMGCRRELETLITCRISFTSALSLLLQFLSGTRVHESARHRGTTPAGDGRPRSVTLSA